MASNSSTECGICSEIYTEEARCPRLLPCSHCICSPCLERLVQTNNRYCPFCRKNFVAVSSQSLPINRSLIDILKYCAELESIIGLTGGGKVNQLAKIVSEFGEENKQTNNKNLVDCLRAKYQIKEVIRKNIELRESFSQTNKTIEEEVLPKLQEIQEENDKQIKYLEEENGRLEIQLGEISSHENQISYMDAEWKSASGFTAVTSIIAKSRDTTSNIKDSLNDLKDSIASDEKTQLCIGKVAKEAARKISLLQLTLTFKAEEDSMVTMATQSDDTQEVMVKTLQRMSGPIQKLCKENRIWAVQDLQGKKRYARISITEEDQLYLHHLEEEEDVYRPRNSHLVKFEDVMTLVDLHCRRTFLELTMEGNPLVRLIIRLFNDVDNKYAQQFSILCTGEMGPSYANTNSLRFCEHFVRMGDYQYNDTRGGNGLLKGVNWFKEGSQDIYKKPWVKGIVRGFNRDCQAAQFFIYTTNNHVEYLTECLGVVEEGLAALTEAKSKIVYNSSSKLKIIDCGILLCR